MTKSKLDYRLNVRNGAVYVVNQRFRAQYQKHKSVVEVARKRREGGGGWERWTRNLRNSRRISSGEESYEAAVRNLSAKSIATIGNISRSFWRKSRRRTSAFNVAVATILPDLRGRIAVVTTHVGSNGLRLRVQRWRENQGGRRRISVSESMMLYLFHIGNNISRNEVYYCK